MAKKTEKQIEVNRLYQQEILTVEMSDCKLGTYVEYERNCDAVYKMCIINGQRWVQIDQFYNGMWADKLCRDGSLKDGDLLHVKTLIWIGQALFAAALIIGLICLNTGNRFRK